MGISLIAQFIRRFDDYPQSDAEDQSGGYRGVFDELDRSSGEDERGEDERGRRGKREE